MKRRWLGILISMLLSLPILATAQTRSMDGATYIETVLANRVEKEGGKAEDLWNRPWRFVFLFNSAQAANKSGYTNSSLSTVRTFLLGQRIGPRRFIPTGVGRLG